MQAPTMRPSAGCEMLLAAQLGLQTTMKQDKGKGVDDEDEYGT